MPQYPFGKKSPKKKKRPSRVVNSAPPMVGPGGVMVAPVIIPQYVTSESIASGAPPPVDIVNLGVHVLVDAMRSATMINALGNEVPDHRTRIRAGMHVTGLAFPTSKAVERQTQAEVKVYDTQEKVKEALRNSPAMREGMKKMLQEVDPGFLQRAQVQDAAQIIGVPLPDDTGPRLPKPETDGIQREPVFEEVAPGLVRPINQPDAAPIATPVEVEVVITDEQRASVAQAMLRRSKDKTL